MKYPETHNATAPEASSARKWAKLRFSLRTMLAVITIVCILIPTWILPSERQRRAEEQIDSINGSWAFSGENIVKIRNHPVSRSWFEHFYRRLNCVSLREDALMAETTDQPKVDWKWLPYLKRFDLAGDTFWGSDKICRTTPILKLLTNSEKIEEVNLSDAVVDSDGIAILAQMPNLRFLRASGTLLDDEYLIELSKLTKLETLEVTLNLFSPASIFKNFGVPQLAALKSTVTAEGVAALATLPQLESLKMNVAGKDSPEIFGPLKNFRSLKSLELNYSEANDEVLVHIGKMTGLEELIISNPQITDDGLSHLKNLKPLKKLDLSSSKITGSGFKDLSNLQKLEILTLTVCDDLKPACLSNLLQLQGLRKIRIDSPLCTKEDMEPLLQLPKLEKIIFDFTELNVLGTKCGRTLVINKDGTTRDFHTTDIFD